MGKSCCEVGETRRETTGRRREDHVVTGCGEARRQTSGERKGKPSREDALGQKPTEPQQQVVCKQYKLKKDLSSAFHLGPGSLLCNN